MTDLHGNALAVRSISPTLRRRGEAGVEHNSTHFEGNAAMNGTVGETA